MPEISEEFLKSLQKSQEGLVLGLGAISEVLQKQSEYFAKQDVMNEMKEEEERKKIEEDEEKESMDSLTKAVAEAVMKQVRDLYGDKPVGVGGKTKWPLVDKYAGKDSEEKVVTPRVGEGEAQRPIQAQDMSAASTPEKKDEMEYPKKEEMHPDEHDHIEKADLAKQLLNLQKSFEDYKKEDATRIDTAVKSKLGALGYHEDKSLVSPKISNKSLGVNDSLIKSEPSKDPLEELAKLDWATLHNMHLKAIAGGEGIPEELMRKMS